MMKRDFNVIIKQDADGYFVISVPNLPGCHTQAHTFYDTLRWVQDGSSCTFR